MKTVKLGNHIRVSELGIGTLTMSPMQRDMSIEAGGNVILYAIKQGINFIDTAQMYGSYDQVGWAISKLSESEKNKLVIISKTAKKTYEECKAAIEEAIAKINRDYIDVFLLHALRSPEDFSEREGALHCLLEHKKSGIIKSIGISSHNIASVKAVINVPEIEVVHPIINFKGFGIKDGNRDEMLLVLKDIKAKGKYVYAMKVLAGGNLRDEAEESIKWAKDCELIDASVIGMISKEEVDVNIKLFNAQVVPNDLLNKVKSFSKRIFINEMICSGCGNCVNECEQDAIYIENNKAKVKHEDCILCAYCSPVCPNFAIRVI